MKQTIRFFLFSLLFSFLSINSFSQKIVVFDKGGKVKRVRYFEGEYISLKTTDKVKLAGTISSIKDSSFVVGGIEVFLDSVVAVYKTQTGMGYRLGRNVFIIPAIGYLPLISFNGLINNDSPIVRRNQIYTGVAFMGVAAIFHFLANKPYKIRHNRPLKIIDISI